MAKVQDRGLIWHAAPGERQPCKAAHRGHVLERLFHRRITQRKPLLHKVNAQHGLKRVGTPTITGPGANGFDQPHQWRSGRHRIHLRQKDLAPGLLALGSVFDIGKTDLTHRDARKKNGRLDGRSRQLTVP